MLKIENRKQKTDIVNKKSCVIEKALKQKVIIYVRF